MTEYVRVPREAVEEIADDLRAISLELTKKRATTPVSEDVFRKALELEAMLAASPQGAGSSADAQGWRDIATAPRDGTMLLVGYDEGVAREGAMEDRQRVFEARWNDVQGTWSARNGFLLHSDATHWQPLPHPPSAHPAPIKPSVDTGELREKMKRAIWTQLPQEDANMGTSGRIADTILDIIQSERAG